MNYARNVRTGELRFFDADYGIPHFEKPEDWALYRDVWGPGYRPAFRIIGEHFHDWLARVICTVSTDTATKATAARYAKSKSPYAEKWLVEAVRGMGFDVYKPRVRARATERAGS